VGHFGSLEHGLLQVCGHVFLWKSISGRRGIYRL